MKNFKLITSALLSLILSSSLAVNVSAIGRPSPSDPDPENYSLIDPEDASVVWPYNRLIEITTSDGLVFLCHGDIRTIGVLSESDVPTTSEEIRDIFINERFRGAVVETDGEPYVIVFEFDYENQNYYYVKTDINPEPVLKFNYQDRTVSDYKTGELIARMDEPGFVVALEAVPNFYLPSAGSELSFPEVAIPPVTEVDTNTGDLNSDGNIDVTDLSELSLALADGKEFTDEQQNAADVDKDGKVTLADLARMRQFLSKIIEDFWAKKTFL